MVKESKSEGIVSHKNFFSEKSDLDITNAYYSAHSCRDLCIKLGKERPGPGDFKSVKLRLEALNLSWDDLVTLSRFRPRGRKFQLNELFVADSNVSRGLIKTTILKYELIPYLCSNGHIDEWEGKPLVLVLDHINGVNNDHRLENLRFLCPNCNSQTATFCGRNSTKSELKRVPCRRPGCLNAAISHNKVCASCLRGELSGKVPHRKIWPTNEELAILVWEKPTSDISKEFEISVTSISDICKKFAIKKPPRGYWTLVKSGATPEQLSSYCAKYGSKYGECKNVKNIQWPNPKDLESLLWKKPAIEVAKIIGVSDVAVSKHCKLLGIQKPPRGFWALVKAGANRANLARHCLNHGIIMPEL